MAKVALYTLGCKVNQYETQKLAEEFAARGFTLVDFSDVADVYVVNTCTVTQVADSKSRQAARAALRRNPYAKVVVTGCYAERSPAELQELGVSVIGNQGKNRLVDFVVGMVGNLTSGEESSSSCFHAPSTIRTRALLKVQDGCNQFCSYCAVPLVRPVMSCKPLDEAVAEARSLVERGHREIVVTGIRLGVYKDDNGDLVTLLKALAQLPNLERIRLSSIELTDIPPGLVDLIAENPKVCRHLHIPLQSGDDGVLARMNRPYTTKQFADFVNYIRRRVPEIAITTDVMVGFPGETIAEFEATYAFAEAMGFTRMHVFRYSPRPGTAAADMADDVPDIEKDQRSRLLIELGEKLAHNFAKRFVGTIVKVLVEGKGRDGMRSGLTDHYVRAVFPAADDIVGKIVDVHINAINGSLLCGTLCEV
jgi:threonylcarbamoyladenosine tRNA methylthiotransferase MtaB